MTEKPTRGLSAIAGLSQVPEKTAEPKKRTRKKKKTVEAATTTVKITASSRDRINAVKMFLGANNTTEATDAMFEAFYNSLERADQRFLDRIIALTSGE